MHETAIAQALLERVESEASARGASVVTRVAVRLGEAAGVEAGLLARAWTLVRAGSLAAAAELELASEAVSWCCPACGHALAPGAILRCPECARPARLVRGGDIFLDRVEMEVP